MKSALFTLDDPSVKLRSTRPSRVFSLRGAESSPGHPYPHTIHSNGLHLEPRMNSLFAFSKSFNLNPGEDAVISQLYLEGTHHSL